MGDNTNNNPHSIADYLAQLLKDRKQLGAFPNVFLHVERLLDEGKYPMLQFVSFSSVYLLFKKYDTHPDRAICWASS